MDAMKILGSILASGSAGRGSSGGNIMGSILGSALGGGQQGAGSGLAGMLGGLMGGAQQQGQSGGGLAGMLGGLMGGGSQQQQGQSGGLAGMLGGLMGGGSQQQQQGQSGGLGGMLGSMLGGGQGQQQSGGVGDLLGGLMGNGGQQGGGLGDLLGASLGKFAETQDPKAAEFTNQFMPADSDQSDAQAKATLVVRAMINAAKSDGEVDQTEMSKILNNLGDSSDEANFIRQEASKPMDLQGLINDVPAGMEQQIYLMSLMAIDLDSQAEAQYLNQLAQGLNISNDTCNQIHEQVSAPKLYQ